MKNTLTPILERILRRVDKTDSCWLWTGAIDPVNGYGRIGVGRAGEGTVLVHRAMYESVIGSIADGLEIGHLCATRNCVRPDHLRPMTHQENMAMSRRAVCKRGHPMGGDNVRIERRGDRTCRACERERYKVQRLIAKNNKRGGKACEEDE